MIAVFGSINVDLVVNVPNLPIAGETVVGKNYILIPGGKGANQALAAKRAGAEVRMIGAIGDDDFSRTALKNLNTAGVNLDYVVNLNGTTGVALIGISPKGENQIIVASGVNQQVEPGWLDNVVNECRTLLFQLELPIESVEEAIAIARREKCQIILNSAPFDQKIVQSLQDVDVLIANEIEAEAIALELGISTEPCKFLEEFVAKFNNKGIITLGSNGCVGHDGSQAYEVFPPDVEAVDTTGAGDAFVGCFVACLDQGLKFENALIHATIAGSLACTVIGAQDGIPYREQIEDMYNDYSKKH